MSTPIVSFDVGAASVIYQISSYSQPPETYIEEEIAASTVVQYGSAMIQIFIRDTHVKLLI